LQKLSLTGGLPPEKLFPARKQLIATMVAKGWIRKQPDGTYCKTSKGIEAMKALLPERARSLPHQACALRTQAFIASLEMKDW
jgi:hypothetical protein